MRFLIAISSAIALLTHTHIHAKDEYLDCKRIGRWTGCIAVPMASMEQDKAAKVFSKPPSESARSYIVRPYTREPKAKSEVYVDGKLVGILRPFTFLSFEIRAGRHTVRVKTGHDADIELEAHAKQNLFLQYQLNQWLGRATGGTKILSNEVGQSKVSRVNRAMNVATIF